jgi:hypothetical protein
MSDLTTDDKGEFLQFSNAAYSTTASPIDGLMPGKFLTDANGKAIPLNIGNIQYDPLTGFFYDSDTGFRAVIYANNDRSTIVIAYRGTVGGSDLAHSLEADAELAVGKTPEQFTEGDALFNVIKTAFPKAGIFLTGHSLGGAIAEFVSSRNRLHSGDTFAAPGITIPGGATRQTALLDVVDQADPVGTFTGVIPGSQEHVGTVDPIGQKSLARILFGDSVLGKLIGMAVDVFHHKIKSYAKLLDVKSLEDSSSSHSLIDDPASPLVTMATFDNAVANQNLSVRGTEITSGDLKIALQTRGDTGTIIGKTQAGLDVNATFVGGDGRNFTGGTNKDQIIALGDRVGIFDGSETTNETLVALGDGDRLVEWVSAANALSFNSRGIGVRVEFRGRRICCNQQDLRGAPWLGSADISCPISPCI